MKRLIELIKDKLENVWLFHRFWVYVGIAISIVLVVLSFFVDIGYIFTIIAVIGLYQFAKKVSKEDPDVLKIEENKKRIEEKENQIEYINLINSLTTELYNLEKYIEKNPTDFVAWKRKSEIEEMLKEF